jgi:hypothetical protein
VPKTITWPDGTEIKITALEANHCPGSCMSVSLFLTVVVNGGTDHEGVSTGF